MVRILGIDTSNYTTSVAIADDDNIIYDKRLMLDVKPGERGLRQSEALFQHINNLPGLLKTNNIKNLNAVCVSERPRPIEGSYMPVFKAGISIAESISCTLDIPIYKTSHQEGHIEASSHSIGFNYNNFIAVHMSGGTTEIIRVFKDKTYSLEIIGGTKDISFGQFIDRIGVKMGLPFPSGRYIDQLAMDNMNCTLRIPSRVDGGYFNLSGQETHGLRYINSGYNQGEICFAVMQCIAKTLEKALNNIWKTNELPVILVGGVAASKFLRGYFKRGDYKNIFFSDAYYSSDNAVGTALIGSKLYNKEDNK